MRAKRRVARDNGRWFGSQRTALLVLSRALPFRARALPASGLPVAPPACVHALHLAQAGAAQPLQGRPQRCRRRRVEGVQRQGEQVGWAAGAWGRWACWGRAGRGGCVGAEAGPQHFGEETTRMCLLGGSCGW